MIDLETRRFLESAKSSAEDVQAMFGGIKAVLEATDDHVRHYIREAPFDTGVKTVLDYHADSLQELLGVAGHLLLEMEAQQDALVHLLCVKVFGNNRAQDGGTPLERGA